MTQIIRMWNKGKENHESNSEDAIAEEVEDNSESVAENTINKTVSTDEGLKKYKEFGETSDLARVGTTSEVSKNENDDEQATDKGIEYLAVLEVFSTAVIYDLPEQNLSQSDINNLQMFIV